jgi:hypothetical protein
MVLFISVHVRITKVSVYKTRQEICHAIPSGSLCFIVALGNGEVEKVESEKYITPFRIDRTC